MPHSDSVDRHIAHWRKELPDLDPQVEGVITRMQMLVRHLKQRRKTALAAHHLKDWEYDILWRLRAVGDPYRLTPTELADALGTHPATLTSRLDRVEAAGYVARHRDPADRRRLLVGLTPQGHQAWRATIGAQDDAEAALLSGLDPAQLTRLNDLLRTLVATAEADGTELMAVPDTGSGDTHPRG